MLSYRCQYPSKEAITVKGGNKSDVILRIVAFYTRCLSCQFGYKAECYLRLEVRAFLTAQLPRRQDRYEATNKLCRGRANADNPSCLIPAGLSVSLGNGEDRYRHRRTRCLRGAGRAAQPTPPVVPSMQTSRPTDRLTAAAEAAEASGKAVTFGWTLSKPSSGPCDFPFFTWIR